MNKTNTFFLYTKKDTVSIKTLTNDILFYRINQRNKLIKPFNKDKVKTPLYFIHIDDNDKIVIISSFISPKEKQLYIFSPDRIKNIHENILEVIGVYLYISYHPEVSTITVLNTYNFEILNIKEYFQKIIGITNYIFLNSEKYLTTQEALNEAVKMNKKAKIAIKTINKIKSSYW